MYPHFLTLFFNWRKIALQCCVGFCHGVLVTQSCLTLCNPMDCSPPSFTVHGILQARILEWVAISFCRGPSWLRDWTRVSHIAGSPNCMCSTSFQSLSPLAIHPSRSSQSAGLDSLCVHIFLKVKWDSCWSYMLGMPFLEILELSVWNTNNEKQVLLVCVSKRCPPVSGTSGLDT